MRTGFQTFAKLVHKLCRLFGVFRGSIIAQINGSTNLSPEQKTQLVGLVNTVDTACSAIDLILVTYEK